MVLGARAGRARREAVRQLLGAVSPALPAAAILLNGLLSSMGAATGSMGDFHKSLAFLFLAH